MNRSWPEPQIVGAIPVSVTQPWLRVKSCRYRLRFAIFESAFPKPEPRVRVNQFNQSEFSSCDSCWPPMFVYALCFTMKLQLPKLITVPSYTLTHKCIIWCGHLADQFVLYYFLYFTVYSLRTRALTTN